VTHHGGTATARTGLVVAQVGCQRQGQNAWKAGCKEEKRYGDCSDRPGHCLGRLPVAAPRLAGGAGREKEDEFQRRQKLHHLTEASLCSGWAEHRQQPLAPGSSWEGGGSCQRNYSAGRWKH
jgi:hypothetical protein